MEERERNSPRRPIESTNLENRELSETETPSKNIHGLDLGILHMCNSDEALCSCVSPKKMEKGLSLTILFSCGSCSLTVLPSLASVGKVVTYPILTWNAWECEVKGR